MPVNIIYSLYNFPLHNFYYVSDEKIPYAITRIVQTWKNGIIKEGSVMFINA